MNVGTRQDNPEQVKALVAQLASDAHVAGEGAFTASAVRSYATTVERHREEDSIGHAIAHQVIDHAVEHFAHMTLGAAAGTVTGVGMAYELLLDKQLVTPMARGHEKNADRRSDAVVVAIATKLAFRSEFTRTQAAARNPDPKMVANVQSALTGKDAALVPRLQARADAGTRAALGVIRSLPKDMPSDARFVAVFMTLQSEGHVKELGTDPAYGLGVMFGLWMTDHLPPHERMLEIENIDARDAWSTQDVCHRG